MHRILHVSATEKLGGAERSLAELAGAVDRSRFELHAMLPGEGALAAALREAGVEVEFAPIQRIRRTVNPLEIARYINLISKASRRIVETARSVGAGLIHANNDVAQIYAGEAAARARVPCVWHARDTSRLGPLGERLSQRAARIIAISDSVREHLVASGVDVSKIRVVRNGIDLRPFEELGPEDARADGRRELGLAEGAFVAGTAGAFVPWKKHEDFVRAFAKLCEMEMADHVQRPEGAGSARVDLTRIVPAMAVVFGADLLGEHGRYVFELKMLADELAGERVKFPGWREDLVRLLPALDVFVSPSESEPFGRVIVEAMAAGVPVVATRSGGKPEIVEDGKTGVLVPQGDAVAIAEAMHGLQRDPGARKSMGCAAREAAFEKFSVERVAREVAEIYEEVLASRA